MVKTELVIAIKRGNTEASMTAPVGDLVGEEIKSLAVNSLDILIKDLGVEE